MKQWWLGFPKLPFKCAHCGAINEIGNVKFEGRFQLRRMTVVPRTKRGGTGSGADASRKPSSKSGSRSTDIPGTSEDGADGVSE